VRRVSSILVAACSAALIFLTGCGSTHEGTTTGTPEAQPAQRDSASQVAHEAALQHFVDGSMFEMKGEYAQAVLEYQDALRYEKDDAVYFALSKCYTQLGKH